MNSFTTLNFRVIVQLLKKIDDPRNGFKKQNMAVNGLFHFLGAEMALARPDEVFQVSDSACSKYATGKQDLPNKLREYLLRQDLDDLVVRVSQRIKEEADFPLTHLVKNIQTICQAPDFSAAPTYQTVSLLSSPFDRVTLEKDLAEKKLADYFAKILIYVVAFAHNKVVETHEEPELPNDFLAMMDDMGQRIHEKRYYESYTRDIYIYILTLSKSSILYAPIVSMLLISRGHFIPIEMTLFLKLIFQKNLMLTSISSSNLLLMMLTTQVRSRRTTAMRRTRHLHIIKSMNSKIFHVQTCIRLKLSRITLPTSPHEAIISRYSHRLNISRPVSD